jgi:hypothetical protein
MANWRISGCPRCKGDLFLDVDERGWFGHCLQCGHVNLESKPRRVGNRISLGDSDMSISSSKKHRLKANN